MLKKILSLLLVITMALCLCLSVSAESFGYYDLYTHKAASTLSFSGTTATCTSTLEGYSGQTTKIVISQTLEKKDSKGNWQYSCSWGTTTVYGSDATVTNYAYNRSKGTYHLKTVFTVYAGDDYEEITKYSFEQTVS